MTEPIGDPVVDPPVDPAADPVEPRTFTQEQLDQIVKDRLARARTKPPEDYDDLKKKAAEFDKLEEKNKTELEKERDRAAAAEKERDTILAEAKEIRLRSAILAEAAKPDRRVVDTDAVISLLDRSSLELDDNGFPTNIAEAVDTLLEERPFLVASAGGTRGNADQGARRGGANQLSREALKSMSPEQIVEARKAGRLDNVLGVS